MTAPQALTAHSAASLIRRQSSDIPLDELAAQVERLGRKEAA